MDRGVLGQEKSSLISPAAPDDRNQNPVYRARNRTINAFPLVHSCVDRVGCRSIPVEVEVSR